MAKTKKGIDPLVAAANVYKLINENDKVRVLQVTIKPGEVAKMHHHPEHVVYVLKGGKAKFTADGKTNEMTMTAGSAVFLAAQSHEVTNIGNSVLDLIVIELKK